MLIQIMNLLLVVSVAWTLCNPLQLERNPAGSSGLTVCSHCFREMEQRLQPCVKNLETFDLCYWKWNHEVLPHFPSHVRDVSPAVRPQWNSLQHKKHKKSKESGMWTSYFTRLSRKTPLLPVFFFSFPFLAKEHMWERASSNIKYELWQTQEENKVSASGRTTALICQWQNTLTFLQNTEEHRGEKNNHQSPLILNVKYTRKTYESYVHFFKSSKKKKISQIVLAFPLNNWVWQIYWGLMEKSAE